MLEIRSWQTFSVQGRSTDVDFVGHPGSGTTIRFCPCSAKEAMDNMYTTEPIKLTLRTDNPKASLRLISKCTKTFPPSKGSTKPMLVGKPVLDSLICVN